MKCVPNTLALHYKCLRSLALSPTQASTFPTAQRELHTSTHTHLAVCDPCHGIEVPREKRLWRHIKNYTTWV